LSSRPFNASSIQVAVDSNQKTVGLLAQLGDKVQIPLIMKLTGVPVESDLYCDAMDVTFETKEGGTWTSGLRSVSTAGLNDFAGVIYMDRSFFNHARKEPLTLRGSLYLTAFGNPQSKTVSVQ